MNSHLKNIFKIFLICITAMLLSSCNLTGGKNLPEMLQNLYGQLESIWQFLFALSYVLGVIFIVMAIMKLKQYGQMTVMMSTHAAMGPSLALFIVGAGLLFLPTFLDTMSWTVWGYGHSELVARAEAGVVDFADVTQPFFRLIMVLGLISLIRGWVMLAKLGNQGSPPGTLSKGLIHMIGGIAAININGTINLLRETFGII